MSPALEDIGVVPADVTPPLSFHCPVSMRPHAERVLKGEYDLAYEHPNPVILDIGANVGSFALWARWRWPNSVIHCYEPLPDNFALLEKNLAAQPAMALHNFAVGDPTRDRLFMGKKNCGESSFFDLGEQQESWVQVITKGPEALPSAQILKLDVEGAEVEILAGMSVLDFDAIVLEYHSDDHRRKVDQLLSDYIMVGSASHCRQRGVVKYLRKSLF
jgi:FkbM family methyltransferase